MVIFRSKPFAANIDQVAMIIERDSMKERFGVPDLIADIGGTHARLALVDRDGQMCVSHTFVCADFNGLSDIIHEFLKTAGNIHPKRAAMAVATPVSGDQINFVNRKWSFSRKALQKDLGLEKLIIMNDFKALALSLPLLEEKDRRKIGGGSAVSGEPIALIGPGTGLGMSGLVRSQEGWMALESEGGHATFAPVDERERSVCHILEKEFGHVSLERLLSGPGLANIYAAISILENLVPGPLAPSDITRQALKGTCPHCLDTLNFFCGALGAAAGNLALTLDARGGVYIGGGMVPRFVDFFEQSEFRHRFEIKGRFSSYLSAIPTYVITAANPALPGLASALGR